MTHHSVINYIVKHNICLENGFSPSICVKREQLERLLLLHQRFGVEEGGTIINIFSRDFFKYLNNFKATGLLMLKAKCSFQSMHTYIFLNITFLQIITTISNIENCFRTTLFQKVLHSQATLSAYTNGETSEE